MSRPSTPLCRECWRRGEDLEQPCAHAPAHRTIEVVVGSLRFDPETHSYELDGVELEPRR